jgi:glycine betaine/proline transport system substrate-binding protein
MHPPVPLRSWTLAAAAVALISASAAAAEAPECKRILLADGGWTDNTAQNALAAHVLDALGYDAKSEILAVPVIMQSLENKDVDIWLDNWMPSQTAETKPFLEKGTVVALGVNLEGAGYGPVVPTYVAEQGVKDLKDLAAHADKFDSKFYGIEAGNDGNRIVQSKMDDPSTGLSGWSLVESSEQGMLVEAQKKMEKKDWVAFLAWTPHPVMGQMDLHYLTGFEADGFGPATIHTLARSDYPSQCPNAAQFFKNLRFTLDMEGAVMEQILAGKDADAAAREWLAANPDAPMPWLEGVTTFDGKPADAAVKAALGS